MVEYGNGGLAVQQRSPWCAGATMVRARYFTRQLIYLLGDYGYAMVEYGNGGLTLAGVRCYNGTYPLFQRRVGLALILTLTLLLT